MIHLHMRVVAATCFLISLISTAQACNGSRAPADSIRHISTFISIEEAVVLVKNAYNVYAFSSISITASYRVGGSWSLRVSAGAGYIDNIFFDDDTYITDRLIYGISAVAVYGEKYNLFRPYAGISYIKPRYDKMDLQYHGGGEETVYITTKRLLQCFAGVIGCNIDYGWLISADLVSRISLERPMDLSRRWNDKRLYFMLGLAIHVKIGE